MNICAVMLVRNEQNIVGYSIYNALHIIGVNRIIIGDNGSDDKTLLLLQAIARRDNRLVWTDAGREYHQAELVNGLAQQASAEGADWILPLDADEFPVWNPEVLRCTLGTSTAAGYALGVQNFAPFRFAKRDTLGSIANLIFRVHPVRSQTSHMDLVVNKQISFLQIVYPPKHLWRASRSLKIEKGNHGATGIEAAAIERAAEASILHAPLRAFDCLLRRIENARRLPAGLPADQSWHLKRMLALSNADALRWEWFANSTIWGDIGPPHRRVRMGLDWRLRRMAKRAGPFVQAAFEYI